MEFKYKVRAENQIFDGGYVTFANPVTKGDEICFSYRHDLVPFSEVRATVSCVIHYENNPFDNQFESTPVTVISVDVIEEKRG